MQISLETERLVLRRFTEGDVDNLVELDSDPDVMYKGFAELGVQRVVAFTMVVHVASRRVMEKAGLRLVRTFHQPWPDHIEGEEEGGVEYALLSRRGVAPIRGLTPLGVRVARPHTGSRCSPCQRSDGCGLRTDGAGRCAADEVDAVGSLQREAVGATVREVELEGRTVPALVLIGIDVEGGAGDLAEAGGLPARRAARPSVGRGASCRRSSRRIGRASAARAARAGLRAPLRAASVALSSPSDVDIVRTARADSGRS